MAANFDKSDLKSVETVVKSGLPTPDEYAREKVKVLASNFDHSELKHVEPQVKTNVAGLLFTFLSFFIYLFTFIFLVIEEQ